MLLGDGFVLCSFVYLKSLEKQFKGVFIVPVNHFGRFWVPSGNIKNILLKVVLTILSQDSLETFPSQNFFAVHNFFCDR